MNIFQDLHSSSQLIMNSRYLTTEPVVQGILNIGINNFRGTLLVNTHTNHGIVGKSKKLRNFP